MTKRKRNKEKLFTKIFWNRFKNNCHADYTCMIPTRIDTSETDTSNKTDDQRRVQTNQRLSSSSITKPIACHLFINQMITNQNKLSFTEFISDQVIYSKRLLFIPEVFLLKILFTRLSSCNSISGPIKYTNILSWIP